VSGGGPTLTPTVINMFAQWEMGGPGRYNRVRPAPPSDSARVREEWFQQCLHAIMALDRKPASIAFPYEIGCGLAGGNWPRYDAMLVAFAQRSGIHVFICRWRPSPSGGGGGGKGNSSNKGNGAVKRGCAGGSGGGSGACYRCGRHGHWAPSCPFK
jgi:hypothetical protein